MYELHPCPQVEINLSPALPQIICQKLYILNKQQLDSTKRINAKSKSTLVIALLSPIPN